MNTAPSLHNAVLPIVDEIISQIDTGVPDCRPPYPSIVVEAVHLLLRVVGRHQHRGVSYIDLVLVGSRGLFKAIDTHEPALHGGFIGHAEPLVEQAILSVLNGMQPDLPLPQEVEPSAPVPNREVP